MEAIYENIMADKDTENLEFNEIEDYKIAGDAPVKIKKTSKKIIISFSKNHSRNLAKYKRISNTQYIDTESGEIKSYSNNVEKYKSKELLQNNMRKLKELILLNFDENTNAVLITLTLDENSATQDLKEIKEYLKSFFKKLKYRFRNNYELCYIYKCEIQGNENWHVHILLKDYNNKKIFFDNSLIYKLWGHGFTYTELVKDNKEFIAFAENDSSDNCNNSSIQRIASYFGKTSQILNIKKYEKVFGCSRNIERAKVIDVTYEEGAKQIADENAILESSKTIEIRKDNKILNVHKKMVYKRRKKK